MPSDDKADVEAAIKKFRESDWPYLYVPKPKPELKEEAENRCANDQVAAFKCCWDHYGWTEKTKPEDRVMKSSAKHCFPLFHKMLECYDREYPEIANPGNKPPPIKIDKNTPQETLIELRNRDNPLFKELTTHYEYKKCLNPYKAWLDCGIHSGMPEFQKREETAEQLGFKSTRERETVWKYPCNDTAHTLLSCLEEKYPFQASTDPEFYINNDFTIEGTKRKVQEEEVAKQKAMEPCVIEKEDMVDCVMKRSREFKRTGEFPKVCRPIIDTYKYCMVTAHPEMKDQILSKHPELKEEFDKIKESTYVREVDEGLEEYKRNGGK